MKKRRTGMFEKRLLALFLSVVMSATSALAALPPLKAKAGQLTTITVDSSSATLTGGGKPTATLSWSYSPALSGTDVYEYAEVYAWAGTSPNRPEKSWYMTVGGNSGDETTAAGGKFSGYLAADTGAEKLSGSCMLQVALIGFENEQEVVLAESTPIGLTAVAPTPPTVETVEYYNNYGGEYTGTWFLYTGGSNNYSAFVLTAVDSEAEAANSELDMSGWCVGGQWYKPIGEETIPDNEIIDKGNGEYAFSAMNMFFTTTPSEGDTVYLALYDYNATALSNLVGITVPASGNKASANAVLEPCPSITTASLPNGSTLENYSATLTGTATNGGALTWSVASGSTLPAGLSLSTSGVLSGRPTQEGDYTFTVSLKEKNVDKAATKTFKMKITGAAPQINTTTLPKAKAGKPYKVKLAGTTARGGTLSWALKSGSSLPTGLTLSTEGEISGTPGASTASETPYSFTVVLTETKSGSDMTSEKELSLTVEEPKKYAVSFALNGGAAATGVSEDIYKEKKDVIEGTELTLPAAPVRRGYTCNGWRYGGKTYQAGAVVTLDPDAFSDTYLAFYAQWDENAAISVTCPQQVVGYATLTGTYQVGENSQNYTCWLDSAYYGEPTTPSMEIESRDLPGRTYSKLELYAEVDGRSQMIASYTGSGDPTDTDQASITLTPAAGMDSLQMVTGLTDNDLNLSYGTDYELRYMYAGGRNVSLPFLTAGPGSNNDFYRVTLKGLESSAQYDRYNWGKSYTATLDNGLLTVAPEPVPDGVYVTGTVTFGSGENARPMAGVQVQISQYEYGQNRSTTVYTNGEGKFTTVPAAGASGGGFQPGKPATFTVLSGGQRLGDATKDIPADSDSDHVADTDVAISISTVSVALATTLDLSAGALTDDQKLDLASIIESNSVNVIFKEGDVFKGNGYLFPGDAQEFYPNANAIDSTLAYEVTGKYFAKVNSNVTLSGGTARVESTLTPKSGVLAYMKLGASLYGSFATAWFNESGTCVGVSDTFTLGNSLSSVFIPCPAETTTGTFTVVLIPATATGAVENLDATTGNDGPGIKSWNVTLAEGQVVALESRDHPFTLDSAASENAVYLTKPNSTITADRESFATTNDLVRFTGTIGLDAGLAGGKLTYLKISPQNTNDGVSYSNTAPVQNIVIDGKVYSAGKNTGDNADFKLTSMGYYEKTSGLNITLPCDYTIYCKPGDADWDMQLAVYATVQTNNNGNNAYYYGGQLVGKATVKKPGASISTLSEYVCDEELLVKGTGKPNDTLDIYDGETLIATVTADKKGAWSARVKLANTDSEYATTHILTSRTETARSEDLYVFHDPNGPQLTQFRMKWNGNKEINVGDAYTYAGGMQDLTFTATFKNPDKLLETTYGEDGDTAKVVFKYWLTNGTIGRMYATQKTEDTFTATLDGTVYSSVTRAEVLYQPILNEKEALVGEGDIVYVDGNVPEGLVMDDGNYHWTATELATLGSVETAADSNHTVDAVFTHTEADNFTITYDNNGQVVTDGLNALLIPAGGETLTEEEKAEVATALNDFAALQKESGMIPQSYSVKYDDEDSTVQWMRNQAENWIERTDRGPGTGDILQTPLGLYSRTFTLRTKEAYTAELTELAGLNTPYHYTLENNGVVTGEEFIFTDAQFGDYELVDGTGTFMAVVTAYNDETSGVYEVDTELLLMHNFTSYGTVIPGALSNNQPLHAALTEDADLLPLGDPTPGSSVSNNQSTTSNTVAEHVSNAGLVVDGVKAGTKVLSKTQKLMNVAVKTGTNATKVGNGLSKVSKTLGKVGTGLSVLTLGLDSYNYAKYRKEAPENAKKMRDHVESIVASKEWKMIQDKILKHGESFTERQCLFYWERDNGTVEYRDSYYGNTSLKPTVRDRLYNSMDLAQYWATDDMQRSTAADVGIWIKGTSTAVGFGGAFIPGVGWAVSGVAGGVNIVGGGICDMLQGRKENARLWYYEHFLREAEYLFTWYAANYGFPEDEEEAGEGGTVDDTAGASESRAEEMIDDGLTRMPPITNKVSNDPSGVVFEGVIENPVEGATVTLWYAANGSGDVVLQNEVATATQILQANGVDDLIPDTAIQTTGSDGKYSWGVPEGLWYVTAQYGELTGNSDDDTAATVTAQGITNGPKLDTSADYNLLPVLPVQLDVNVPIVDDSAPAVEDVVYAEGEGVYVTFSKYMKEGTGTDSCLKAGNYMLKVNGLGVEFTVVNGDGEGQDFKAFDQGHVPANLTTGAGTTYTKTVLLKYAGLAAGDAVALTVRKDVESYAGTAMAADFGAEDEVPALGQLAAPTLTLDDGTEEGTTVEGAEITVSSGTGLTLALADTAPAGAKIYYTQDSGEAQEYKGTIVLTNTTNLVVWAEAAGYTQSDVVNVKFTVSKTLMFTVTFDSNGGSDVPSQRVQPGKTAVRPDNPRRSGYSFQGWKLNGETYDFSTPVTASITLVASWRRNNTPVTHEHDYTEEVTTEPTCTEPGVKTFRCLCGDTYTEEIPALGHDYGEGVVTKEPTVDEPGERTYTCLRCGHQKVEPISKLPDPTHRHVYTETVTKEPTCTEKGTRVMTCECGDTYTEEIPALGHDYHATVTKKPTKTEEGLRTWVCSRCQDTYTEVIEKLPETDLTNGGSSGSDPAVEGGVAKFGGNFKARQVEKALNIYDYTATTNIYFYGEGLNPDGVTLENEADSYYRIVDVRSGSGNTSVVLGINPDKVKTMADVKAANRSSSRKLTFVLTRSGMEGEAKCTITVKASNKLPGYRLTTTSADIRAEGYTTFTTWEKNSLLTGVEGLQFMYTDTNKTSTPNETVTVTAEDNELTVDLSAYTGNKTNGFIRISNENWVSDAAVYCRYKISKNIKQKAPALLAWMDGKKVKRVTFNSQTALSVSQNAVLEMVVDGGAKATDLRCTNESELAGKVTVEINDSTLILKPVSGAKATVYKVQLAAGSGDTAAAAGKLIVQIVNPKPTLSVKVKGKIDAVAQDAYIYPTFTVTGYTGDYDVKFSAEGLVFDREAGIIRKDEKKTTPWKTGTINGTFKLLVPGTETVITEKTVKLSVTKGTLTATASQVNLDDLKEGETGRTSAVQAVYTYNRYDARGKATKSFITFAGEAITIGKLPANNNVSLSKDPAQPGVVTVSRGKTFRTGRTFKVSIPCQLSVNSSLLTKNASLKISAKVK